MQDVHWFAGLIGYFPTYTLGAVIAAQIFAALKESVPNVDELVRAGDFGPLIDWLRREVHGQGRLVTTPELVRRVTGAPLSTDAFRAHLGRRYT